MTELSEDAWFYTREGERAGPVTFAELQAMAREAVLNPRLDLVWGRGMDGWKPAGEVDGLFEKRREPQESKSLAPDADPYTPPKPGDLQDLEDMTTGWPGARRRSFLLAVLVFPMVWNFCFTLGAQFIAMQLGPQLMRMVTVCSTILPAVVGIYFTLMRLVNLGMSRWWYLANFVPFLNLWLGYRVFACPAGYAYHKKLDGAGVVLAILYWLMVVVMILAIAAVIALLFGGIHNPAMHDKLQEILRTMQEKAARS